MIPHGNILAELARVKAIFQLRAISAVIGVPRARQALSYRETDG